MVVVGLHHVVVGLHHVVVGLHHVVVGLHHVVVGLHHVVVGLHHVVVGLHHGVVGLHHVVVGLHHVVVGLYHVVVWLYHVVVGLHHVVVGLHHVQASALLLPAPSSSPPQTRSCWGDVSHKFCELQFPPLHVIGHMFLVFCVNVSHRHWNIYILVQLCFDKVIVEGVQLGIILRRTLFHESHHPSWTSAGGRCANGHQLEGGVSMEISWREVCQWTSAGGRCANGHQLEGGVSMDISWREVCQWTSAGGRCANAAIEHTFTHNTILPCVLHRQTNNLHCPPQALVEMDVASRYLTHWIQLIGNTYRCCLIV